MAILTKQSNSDSRRTLLERHLYDQIHSGKLRPGEKLSTVELAKEWNISEGTVNQSLHILAAKGLLVRKRRAGTFVGDISAHQLQPDQTNQTIALILPDLKTPEFSFLMQGLQHVVNDSSFVISAHGTQDQPDNYEQVIRDQIKAAPAAIVMVPPLRNILAPEILIELYESKIPVVTCFRAIEGFGWPTVRLNFVRNTQLAAEHLCAIGRQHIALVYLETARIDYFSLANELTFIRTLESHGITTRKNMHLSLDSGTLGEADERMWLFKTISDIEDWLRSYPEIDGICCLHDIVAWPVLSALAKMGKQIPEDIAVVGNGNMMEMFGFTQNDLTTVDSRYDDFGRAVIDLINDMVDGKKIELNTMIEISGELIVRHSTVGNGSAAMRTPHFEKEID